MNKSYRLLALLCSLASIGIFLLLFGYLLSTVKTSQNISDNLSPNYKYLFLQLTRKPQSLIAQMQISAKPTNQGKIVEESANTIIVSEPAIHSSDLQMDSVSIKEKNDSTNSILDENWIQQVIQMKV